MSDALVLPRARARRRRFRRPPRPPRRLLLTLAWDTTFLTINVLTGVITTAAGLVFALAFVVDIRLCVRMIYRKPVTLGERLLPAALWVFGLAVLIVTGALT